jgi:hypothetical protein
MIFSNSKQEIYYLLSYLLKSYDIEIIKSIYNKKRELEDIENLRWYIKEGNKYKKYKEGIIINHILFNPYHESVKSIHVYHKKTFHLKILIEIFGLKGFILIKHNNEYILPTLKTQIQILNTFVDNYGILEIYNKIFQYHINLTDLVGNRCIRSIILDNNEYIYKTIALRNEEYIEPVDRLPRYI